MARPLLAPPPSRPVDPGPAPTFSVVIPAYEVADLVGEAVRSALEQTRAPVEVIVVDDGSPDDVAGALAPYRDRIVLIRQPNQGAGAAKLAGARAASAEFVAFLDGDDYYLPERLEALAEAGAARPDLDILLTDAWVEVNGERARTAYDATWAFAVDDQRTEILDRCFVIGHAAARRSALMALDGLDPETLDDWETWGRLILAGARAGLVDEPLSCYRVRRGSASTQRATLCRRGVATLRVLGADEGLSDRERAVVDAAAARWSRMLAIETARDALERGDRRAAAAALRQVVCDRRQGLRARVKALVSMVAPSWAGRVIARRARTRWVGAAGVHVAGEEIDAPTG
ncbi:MAG TPA: glycosyltransferase [Solirubrobacteraceae bacterium]|nr:glycosyltransferase [Solirubrobacteraceae bacterium]